MNVIESPVDALVFDYVRIGLVAVVNSLWAWVAVITAAVSFWRMRAVSGAGAVPVLTAGCSSLKKSVHSLEPAVEMEPAPEPEPSISECSKPAVPKKAPASSGFYDGESVTKGKFVVYYDEDWEDDGNGGCDGDREGELTEWCNGGGDGDGEGELTEWCNGGGDGCGEWWSTWEKVLMIKRGEMGWYKYQDLTSLSGNVVRLWDGVRRDALVR